MVSARGPSSAQTTILALWEAHDLGVQQSDDEAHGGRHAHGAEIVAVSLIAHLLSEINALEVVIKRQILDVLSRCCRGRRADEANFYCGLVAMGSEVLFLLSCFLALQGNKI